MLIFYKIYRNTCTEKKWFIEFTKIFKVSGCNQFILVTFKGINFVLFCGTA